MTLNFFTSESVSPGHPDKMADQVADAILDHILMQDESAHVALEVLIKSGMVWVAGEVTSEAHLALEPVVRALLRKIGYHHSDTGFSADSCAVVSSISEQSPDIRQGVCRSQPQAQGAGDQGTVFGYATDEGPEWMPAPIYYAHRLMKAQHERLNSLGWTWLRPDAKAQVTLAYASGRVVGLHACTFSTQHDESVSHQHRVEQILEEIIFPTFPKDWIGAHTQIHINPTGRFVVGGPQADCGVTGRKLMVDTYGGIARHGGGAFSGKDPSKVDRSAAYMARYIAKNLVAAQLASRCEVQLSYAIGVAQPLLLHIDTQGTSSLSSAALKDWVAQNLDLTPWGLQQRFSLRQLRYLPTATFGHFGRSEFPWESTDLKAALQSEFGKGGEL